MDNPGVIGAFIPIIFFLVMGLVFVTAIYFKSREKQMLIEKGLDAQSIKEYFEQKRDPYWLMKLGIIIVGFGLGLGLGIMLKENTDQDYWVVLLMFTFTGIAFIIANAVGTKLKRNTRSINHPVS